MKNLKTKNNAILNNSIDDISKRVIYLRDWMENQIYLEIGKDNAQSKLYYPGASFMVTSQIRNDVAYLVSEFSENMDYSKKYNQKKLELITELLVTEDYLFNLELRANLLGAQKTSNLTKIWREHLTEQRKNLELCKINIENGVVKND